LRKAEITIILLFILSLLALPILAAQQIENELIIYHYYTAGGEREAIDVYFKYFREKYPFVKIRENEIPGGAAENIRAVVMSRLEAGNPPDIFLDLAGANLKRYVDAGYLAPVDEIWKETNMEEHVPPLLRKMCYFYGHYYGVQANNVHRENILFYNKHLFDDLGLTPPRNPDELVKVASAIKSAKPTVAPLVVSTKDYWHVAFFFDPIIYYYGGKDYYLRFFTGRVNFSNPNDVKPFKEALNFVKTLVEEGYLVPSTAWTWDMSCSQIARGRAAMGIYGDWALGYFISIGLKIDEDIGGAPFPGGDDEVYLIGVDAFVMPKGAPHPNAAKAWLLLMTDPQIEYEFALKKGSIAGRDDAPKDYPDSVRRENIEFLLSHPELVIPHGTFMLAPPAFLEDFCKTIIDFFYTKDVEATIRSVAALMEKHNVAEFSSWIWED